jgi:hypothetical protein
LLLWLIVARQTISDLLGSFFSSHEWSLQLIHSTDKVVYGESAYSID